MLGKPNNWAQRNSNIEKNSVCIKMAIEVASHFLFLRRYQVRRLIPSFSHGLVRLSALSASRASGRPPRFELVGPLDSAAVLSPLSATRSISKNSDFLS